MRIVLLEHPRIQSEFHYNDIANTPLWSCLMTGYAASSLHEAGFEADILDASHLPFNETIDRVVDSQSDLLCIHAVYFWEKTEELFRMISQIRARGYRGIICLYGFFPTLVWSDILDSIPEVDCIIVGEPERTIADLAQAVKNGGIKVIDGLAFRIGSIPKLLRSGNSIGSIDLIPFPARPFLESQTTVNVLASRGCYNGCSFCLIPAFNGGRPQWRSRSTENVVAEISKLVQCGKQDIYFVDPNFVGPGQTGKERTTELARALSTFRISFGMETRAADITDKLLADLCDAGLNSLLLGIESGSPGVLKRLAKNMAVEQNEHSIALVRAVGIEPEIGFIMFETSSTINDISENLRFLEHNQLLGKLGRTANLLYHEHIAFRGTHGYARAIQQGMLKPCGIFGFEGQPVYRDERVGWLASMMRPICQFLLKEMDRDSSGIHWSTEAGGNNTFLLANNHLVDVFKSFLLMATGFSARPTSIWSAQLVDRTISEISQTISRDKKAP